MVLVTGATGFLGRNLCPYLVAQGYRLRALVRSTSNVAFLRELGVELVYGDVRDLASLRRAVQGCRWVVHAAGKFRFWGRREDFFAVNVDGTANVLAAAARAEVDRLVYISTLAVVGAPRPGQLLDEQVQCEPRDAYQRSKLEAESLVLSTCWERGLPTIVLRPGAFYGPWGRYAFNRMFFEDPLKGLPVGVCGGTLFTFPLFVPDMAHVIVAAFARGRPGEIYNVAGPSLTHAQVHGIISRLAGVRPWRVNPPKFALIGLARLWTFLARFTGREPYYSINMVPYVFSNWKTTSEKAQRDLGFVPTSFEDGARRTIAWYREQGIGPTTWLGRLVVRLWRAPEAYPYRTA
jgi:dihydroflavonol-4-reductase